MGSHSVDALLARGLAVTVFDDFSTGSHTQLDAKHPALSIIEGDVRDPAALARACVGCDAVLHLAALVSVPLSLQQPALTHAVNATGARNVLEAARQQGIGRVVLASSAAVYGVPAQLPLPESAPTRPISPYGAQKLEAETMAAGYASEHGPSPICLRYFNVFGPRQDPSSPYSGVLSRFLGQLIAGQPCTIEGDGSQTRDFVYVTDVAAANLAALLAAPTPTPRVFNIGTGQAVSVLQAYETLARRLGVARPPLQAAPRVGDISHSVAAVVAAQAELGFRARVGFDEGLAATLAWARARATAV